MIDDIEFTKQYWKDQNTIKKLDLENERLRQQNAELRKALLRSQQGWENAIELGIIHERYIESAESILMELRAIAKATGSDNAKDTKA